MNAADQDITETREGAAGWRARLGVLVAAAAVGVGLGAASAAFPDARNAAITSMEAAFGAAVAQTARPLTHVKVVGARSADPDAVAAAAAAGFPAGSGPRAALGYDVDKAREQIELLGWVRRAEVSIRAPSQVLVRLTERAPAALWRRGGRLSLLDASGAWIADVDDGPALTAARAGLPLVLGVGADQALGEALALIAQAEEAGLVVAGLTRVGQRRWDLHLVDGPKTMLPENGARMALGRMLAWIREADLMRRELALLDLRLPHAPTARLPAAAARAAQDADPEAPR